MPRKARPVSTQELLASFTSSLRRTSSRPTIAGYAPMDHQMLFHQNCSRGRAFIGGNRSGKTVSGGTEAVFWLTGKHPYRPTPKPPVFGRGVAVDFDHGVDMIMKPEIARWMPPSELINGSWERSYNKSSHTLTLANGSTLEFLSTDQELDKHAGTSRHFVWFDEEPPKEYFDENRIRLIDVGGSWWLTMTPLEGMSWTYDDVYLASQVDDHVSVFTASMDQNIHVNSLEIDLYLSGLTDEEKKARREGRYVQLGGVIYAGHFDPDVNIIDPIVNSQFWESYKKNWVHFLAMDHGFNNPTAWLWFAADKDQRIVVYDEYYLSREIVKNHAKNVLAKMEALEIEAGYFVGDPSIKNIDPITGTSVQLEYQEHGLSIVPGNNDVKAGINRVARLFENRQLFICRNCQQTLWELNRYRWAKWSSKKIESTRNVKDEPAKKDDHAMDALRYGIASRYGPDEELIDTVKIPFGFAQEPHQADKPLTDLDLNRVLRETDVSGGAAWYVDSILGNDY